METSAFGGFDLPTLSMAHEQGGLTVADGLAYTNHWVALAASDALTISGVGDNELTHERRLKLLQVCQDYVGQHRELFACGLQAAGLTADLVLLTDPLTGLDVTIRRRWYAAFVSDGDSVLPAYYRGTRAIVVKGDTVVAVIPATVGSANIHHLPRLED